MFQKSIEKNCEKIVISLFKQVTGTLQATLRVTYVQLNSV